MQTTEKNIMWVFRFVILIGGIVTGMTGNEELALALFGGLFLTFLYTFILKFAE